MSRPLTLSIGAAWVLVVGMAASAPAPIVRPELAAQCAKTFGAPLGVYASPRVVLESFARGKVGQHAVFEGDYAGVEFELTSDSGQVNLGSNTFVEYADRSVGRSWIAWFPDRSSDDGILAVNGTAISVKIDMDGAGAGEAWGNDGGGVALGYGTTLFQHGAMALHWNMAFSNLGNVGGSLQPDTTAYLALDAVPAPSARRVLLLFPAKDVAVRRLVIAGSEFAAKPPGGTARRAAGAGAGAAKRPVRRSPAR